ncbi:MAG: hypothetical protein ABJH72_17445 [Reichenbachiella sp.]|uniref:hypothetical protein n=1 Tax=Reichenbachiella sp. TaxID=2184521 RepID=UPI0032985AE0
MNPKSREERQYQKEELVNHQKVMAKQNTSSQPKGPKEVKGKTIPGGRTSGNDNSSSDNSKNK